MEWVKFYNKKKIWWVSLALLVFLLISSAAVYVLKISDKQLVPSPVTPVSKPIPTPTPIPFYELTIPYLRERQYKSSLGELKKVSENADYTSYLTSYDSDGLTVNGLLTIPKGSSEKFPAIVFVHGYISPTQYKTLVNYASYVDYLARNGFVVFKIDLRGHGTSEGEPEGAYYSSDYAIDTLNAYAALQSSAFVHPEKIGLWGHSMAGNVVFRSMAGKPGIPAVVIWAGAVYTYSDFREYGIADRSYQPRPTDSPSIRKRNALFEQYGQFDPENAFWRMVPGTNYLSELRGAVQLNHVTDDPIVDIRYSRNLNMLLNNTSIPHELHEYSSGGHNLTGEAFTQAMEATVEFFKRNLE